ncbi:MAG: PAS domain-containing protein [Pseudomonadota bacterium]
MFALLRKNQNTSLSQNPSAQQSNSAPAVGDFNTQEVETFLGISDDAHVIISANGQIEKCNETFLEITGYAPQDIQSMHFMDLFQDQDKPHIRGSVQAFDAKDLESEMNQDRPTFDFEARILKADGSVCWMEWRQQLVNQQLYCTGRDITDIKRQKKSLSRREKQLSEAESIGRMGHWSWTIGEETMEWSDQIHRIFGVQDTEFETTLDAMNKMVHREDIARVNQAFQRAVIEENDYDMEFRVVRPDGDIRHIRCEGRCSFDKSGEVVALYGIMQDMTERMLYESDLRKAKEQAEKAYASRTQFLANMSHELRTPLNAIIGFSEMIEHQLLGPIGTEKYLEYIGGIRESGEHLLDLISDILDMSKIEAGKYELDLEEVNVTKVMQLAAHMMEGRAHESGVKIEQERDFDEDFKIIADRRAVLQILLNLVSNAVKFTPDGGQVKIAGFKRENYLSIKVIDNGIGIPANKMASVTKPFEQVSSSYARDHEGSGLGLAITKDLLEMHGGTLFIDSKVDEGTSVTVRLPFDAHKATNSQS